MRDEFLINPVVVMPTPLREVPSWDQYYLGLLSPIAARSKDARTQVGAVLIGRKGEPLGFGYNGFVRGIKETPFRWERNSGQKHLWTVHAEANAVAQAARVGIPLDGATAYVNFCPCVECSKLLLSAGIVRVVVDKTNHDLVNSDHWSKNQPIVDTMFAEAGARLDWVVRL
jgi:dCMP deaminase